MGSHLPHASSHHIKFENAKFAYVLFIVVDDFMKLIKSHYCKIGVILSLMLQASEILWFDCSADQGCSQGAARDAGGVERNAAVQQQAVTAVATAAAVAVAAQQQDRLNSSGSSSLSLMSPNGTGLAHSAVSSLLALSQQQQTQGMTMSQSTQQTIADAIGARNNAVWKKVQCRRIFSYILLYFRGIFMYSVIPGHIAVFLIR